jgi:TolA-binding protein
VKKAYWEKETLEMKSKKLITSVLITVIICATLALGFQQDPLRLPNPFSGSKQTQEKNDQPTEVKDLHLRITKLESKIAQLERRIEELQKPRMTPLNQK